MDDFTEKWYILTKFLIVLGSLYDIYSTSYAHTNGTKSGDFVVKWQARSAIIDQSAQETGDFHFLSGAMFKLWLINQPP